jgi:hypothetical protein
MLWDLVSQLQLTYPLSWQHRDRYRSLPNVAYCHKLWPLLRTKWDGCMICLGKIRSVINNCLLFCREFNLSMYGLSASCGESKAIILTLFQFRCADLLFRNCSLCSRLLFPILKTVNTITWCGS